MLYGRGHRSVLRRQTIKLEGGGASAAEGDDLAKPPGLQKGLQRFDQLGEKRPHWGGLKRVKINK